MRHDTYDILNRLAPQGNGEARRALEGELVNARDAVVGDIVFCDGCLSLVLRIVEHPAGTHPNSPIGNDWDATEIVTNHGSRWFGKRIADHVNYPHTDRALYDCPVCERPCDGTNDDGHTGDHCCVGQHEEDLGD